MGKELPEMTLGELWELFPIFLAEHNDKWTRVYDEMEATLQGVLSGCRVERISHVGSAAVPGIMAKNIVDVLVGTPADSGMDDVARAIEGGGFIRMSAAGRRMSFNRGYTKDCFADKIFYLHLRYAGDNDELYFRGYLMEHPSVAKEHESLKLGSWKRFAHDRDAYTSAKTEFVRKWAAVTKTEYAGRH